MDKEHWTRSPWTISIGTAVFSLLLTIGYDFLKDKPVLTTILLILKWSAGIIWAFLDFSFKVWWLIAGAVIFKIVTTVLAGIRKSESLKPDFHNYSEDNFTRWKWSWKWRYDSGRNAWIVSEMKAHCPRCDTPMIDYSDWYSRQFDCPRCPFTAHDSQCDDPVKIERIILDNIERNRARRID